MKFYTSFLQARPAKIKQFNFYADFNVFSCGKIKCLVDKRGALL